MTIMAARQQRPTTSVVPPQAASAAEVSDASADGAKAQPRSVFAEVGVVSQAKGSAFFEIGNTKVVAACYGPLSTSRRQGFQETCILDCDVKFSPFSGVKHQQTKQTALERELSQLLESSLKPCVCVSKYPKSVIQVYATVLQDDGAAFSAVINAASMALANAGIEMFDLLAAASVCFDTSGGLHPHPTRDEEAAKVHAYNPMRLPKGLFVSLQSLLLLLLL
ncbi:hypothetical protein PTSG_02318 [Salpingoeca rosetta]|uniref:Exoribonuclease phosphorolytic domain-containing protein n=1 Tax=Salpingoeca rosetta (strain ATCC 50818 / BSB-021) TaxID=946362 RepID=F2U1V1_SALR5|nr:uncharacterized protein PTSG_02318 [Salpingoeca rosetta]EGD81603.1 hypothetical protein PTSG_02318 [Salpingoeca rosetta]|eukprot:XP_004996807.1 hypothetical protein PTSG_02318 [Salpingoeca rosetta]